MKNYKQNIALVLVAIIMITQSGCLKGDLLSNPNVAAESSTISPSLILNHLTSNLMKEEEPIISSVYRYNQNIVSNYSYYFGSNSYGWSNTSDNYDNLKYCAKMEEQSKKQTGNTTNIYFALSAYFKAYTFIWISQRVGDIPMSQAGDPVTYPNPAYDKQKDIFKNALVLLENANGLINDLYSKTTVKPSDKVDATGDIYGLSYQQWQKVINTYRLRVLISLSKRADDNPDLNVKSQFAAIVTNPAKYPIMTSNSDNMYYRYTAITFYPPNRAGYAPYNNCENINKTYLDLLKVNNDPRLYVLTTPALKLIKQGKMVSDSSAYLGEDNTKTQSSFSNFSSDSAHSCLNYNRYMSSASGANCEPYILIGYPEMCFNIAEAANKGWLPNVTASVWYANGVNASLNLYGITQNKVVTIGNYDGTNTNIGSVSLDVNTFLGRVGYAGDNAAGLNQILTQKYIAFFMNSGFESFYNWRRTGVPTFAQGGAGVGTPSTNIPLRWQYPNAESIYNTTNYNAALQSQYGGTDDLTAKMWLIK